mmetsp:Transcript_85212/g.260469  ORF Transcript_85212/g.260469 Transcript_85212/m.260469 type:complete len:301 (-) Transcript_85212:40-942(-)
MEDDRFGRAAGADLEVHHALRCNVCGAGPPLIGRVMVCADCDDFVMCSRCHSGDGRWFHPSNHRFFYRTDYAGHRPGRIQRAADQAHQGQRRARTRGGAAAFAAWAEDAFDPSELLRGPGGAHFLSQAMRHEGHHSIMSMLVLAEEEMVLEALRASVEEAREGRRGARAQPTEDPEAKAAAALSRLPRITWGKAGPGQEDRDEECALCLDEFCEGEQLVELGCRHVFHAQCLQPWLARSMTCPMCKGDIEPPQAAPAPTNSTFDDSPQSQSDSTPSTPAFDDGAEDAAHWQQLHGWAGFV